MLHDTPREMTIWEAADIIACMIGGRRTLYTYRCTS